MLQIPNRQKNASAAPTKAVILVSFLTNREKHSSAYTLQVGGPSRGTRFRPLSLDVPKVSSRMSPDARTAMLKTLRLAAFRCGRPPNHLALLARRGQSPRHP